MRRSRPRRSRSGKWCLGKRRLATLPQTCTPRHLSSAPSSGWAPLPDSGWTKRPAGIKNSSFNHEWLPGSGARAFRRKFLFEVSVIEWKIYIAQGSRHSPWNCGRRSPEYCDPAAPVGFPWPRRPSKRADWHRIQRRIPVLDRRMRWPSSPEDKQWGDLKQYMNSLNSHCFALARPVSQKTNS